MIRYLVIFYDASQEICREYVSAMSATEASEKVHQRHPNGLPGPCLSITPACGYFSDRDSKEPEDIVVDGPNFYQ